LMNGAGFPAIGVKLRKLDSCQVVRSQWLN
jgi:hypothetical protein